MISKVISGGQTGADQAGWRAAKAFGIATGGWMPLGFLTEDGPRPEFAAEFGAEETPTRDYRVRTRRNVLSSHATIWLGDPSTSGSRATYWACHITQRPLFLVRRTELTRPHIIVAWLKKEPNITVINIAGNRESKSPGIGADVEGFMREVFRRLGHKETEK